MSIMLDLPQALESALATEATQLGLSLLSMCCVSSPQGPLSVSCPRLVQNSSPIGDARVSLGRGERSPIARRMHGRYATTRKNGSGNSPCTSSIPTC